MWLSPASISVARLREPSTDLGWLAGDKKDCWALGVGRQQVTCSRIGHVLVGLSQHDLRSSIFDLRVFLTCPPWLSLQPIEPRLRQLGQAAVDNQWSPAKQTGEEYKGNQPGTELTSQESITPLLHGCFDFPLAITEHHGFRSHC
jgi:hypothetical protein